MAATDIALNILQIISPVLMAVLGWVATKVAKLIEARVQQEYLRGVLVRLSDVVFTVVKDLNQTLVGGMKDASSDGKLTDAEKQAVKDRAVTYIKSYLGPKGLDTLAKVLGLSGVDLDGFLASKVESAVHDLRAAAPSAPRASAGRGRRCAPFFGNRSGDVNLELARATAMQPGSGELDLALYVRPEAAGGTVTYAHHITEALSATATAFGGAVHDEGGWHSDYGANVGLRYRW